MKQVTNIGLAEVQNVSRGPEGELWELIMGQQIHIGGGRSSMDLAQRAGVQPGWSGVDLACCNGAGMRVLVRYCHVASMHGVDATEAVIERCRQRCRAEGLADRIRFTLADACQTGLPDARFDFVWGEDAWCYVMEKSQLIAEAVRLVKPGGVIAFTDWIEQAGGRIVLDATEWGERALPRAFAAERTRCDPLSEWADAYFGAIPDVFRRPNHMLYDYLGREMSARHVRGLIVRRYPGCDLWHAEVAPLKAWSRAPVLDLEAADSEAGSAERSRGRIEAFLEMLA